MAMFGRKPKGDVRDKPVSQVELRRAVDEGFLIAKSAIVIAVANRIITNALRDKGFFDHALIADGAREELHRLAAEQRGDAERMRAIRSTASKQKGRSRHQHDYKRGDDHALRTREATYEELANRLDAGADQPAFVDGIVLSARARAWDDIGTTVVGRLGWAQAPAEGYEIGRDERVRQLLDEDFTALLADHPLGSGTADADVVEPDDADADDSGSDPADADATRD